MFEHVWSYEIRQRYAIFGRSRRGRNAASDGGTVVVAVWMIIQVTVVVVVLLMLMPSMLATHVNDAAGGDEGDSWW